MKMPTILLFLGCLGAEASAFAMLQVPENKETQDLGTLFSGDKKPCDADVAAQKKKLAAEQAKTTVQSGSLEQAAQQQTNQDNAVQGLIKLGVIPADKPQAEKKSIGMPPPAMANCK